MRRHMTHLTLVLITLTDLELSLHASLEQLVLRWLDGDLIIWFTPSDTMIAGLSLFEMALLDEEGYECLVPPSSTGDAWFAVDPAPMRGNGLPTHTEWARA